MPDLASEVRVEEEAPKVRRIPTGAELRLLGEGITARGPIGEPDGPFDSMPEWEKVYGGLTAATLDSHAAATGFFDGGGRQLWWNRVVHTTVVGDPTTKTSAAGTLNLLTAAASPTAGSVTSAAQPYNLEHGDTLVVAFESGGNQTFTVNATAASRTAANSGPYALSNGMTLELSIDGSATLTKTFATAEFVAIGAATVTEVLASVNAFLAANQLNAVASVQGGAWKITSNRRGTGSGVNVVGGTANVPFAFTTGNIAGTGNVSNVDSVTAAEIAAIAAAITNGTVAVVSGAVRFQSATTGASSTAQVLASSTADDEMGFDNAVHSGSTGTPAATLTVDGKTDGTYAADVTIAIAAATSGEADRFNMNVLFKGVVVERFPNLSMLDADARYVETVVNDALTGSNYVVVTDLDSSPEDRPANGTFGGLVGGDDGLVGLTDTDYTGGETLNGATGLRCFDEVAADVLIVPGRATSAVQNAMVTYCEITREGLLFPIFDPPANQTAVQIVDYVENTASLYELSEFGAFYWPRVRVVNPDKTLFGSDATIVVPPSGHIAGAYARSDARKIGGQFEQPAGVEHGLLPGVLGLEMTEVTKKSKRELVFPKNINPISQEDGTPIFIDGARCLKTSGNWGSVGQRRGVIFVEQRLIPGLAFMRHRNLKPRLYSEGQNTVELFLLDLTRNDAFKSTDPRLAFFVDFGAGLNPPSVQLAKRVVARVGLATSEPGEFVVLLIGPDTRALDEELAALEA